MTFYPEDRAIQAERAMDRQRAITVPCEVCHVRAGEFCVNLTTREPLDQSSHQPAHFRRLQDSGAT